MRNFRVLFEVQPGIYQDVIGDYIEATCASEALVLARQWLIDNGMDFFEALELSAKNKIAEEGYDRIWTF